VNPGVPDFEQRLSAFQTQLDPLQHVPTGNVPTEEQRLALLTEECAEIVRRWALTSERHARAVTRFEAHLTEWNDAGTRLQQDAAQRIEQLENVIQHEWSELKQLHGEPVRQLSEHATSLTQVCIATANAAQQGFERSEARLAAIEGELNRRLGDLTREVHAVVAELRAAQESSLVRLPAPTPQAWPLEGVTRLHHQLRTEDGTSFTSAVEARPLTTRAPHTPQPEPVAGLLPEAALALKERIDSLERAMSERAQSEQARSEQVRSAQARFEQALTNRDVSSKAAPEAASPARRLALAGIAGVVVVGAILAVLAGQVREANARAERAEQAQVKASADAARQFETARQEFTRAQAEANVRAERAQTTTEVLASPDLVKFNLVGRRALTGLSALVSWSATRGVVFSGSQLPPAPAGSTYQLWLLTRSGAVSAGTFSPDASGAVTLAVRPPAGPRPVIGSLVTIETSEGRTSPIGQVAFARPFVPPAPETVQ
jgi:hypothetical protein